MPSNAMAAAPRGQHRTFCLPRRGAGWLLAAVLVLALAAPARAQMGPGGPPVVGVVKVHQQPVTERSEYVGRVQATDHVDIVARVTAFIEQRAFTEGTEVRQGDLLYRLERGPFEADLAAKAAAVAQQAALLRNATITLNRAQTLLHTPAGQQSTVDDALAQQASIAAQLQSAQAQLRASQINLDYTEIRSPIAGKVGRTTLTVGNVVSPGSGPLVSIVSQDPMYVLFPVSVRAALDLRDHYAERGGLGALPVRIRLPQGTFYGQTGRVDYFDPSVSTGTDTLMLRARMPNPMRGANRELVDGEFVSVSVEGAEPVMALGIPRAAVLTDQQGSYVYVVGADNKVAQRRIQLGQSTPEVAVVLDGLVEGETVVADGLQRVRPGMPVNPAPAAATANAAAPAATPARN
jgi:membrane fusion protein (multidrug efflux system)